MPGILALNGLIPFLCILNPQISIFFPHTNIAPSIKCHKWDPSTILLTSPYRVPTEPFNVLGDFLSKKMEAFAQKPMNTCKTGLVS